jgi:hypothetical protein
MELSLIWDKNSCLIDNCEKEHYDVSMKVGELVLFPAIRNSRNKTIIAAPGTSCRHQIFDGTQRKALHPMVPRNKVEFLLYQ